MRAYCLTHHVKYQMEAAKYVIGPVTYDLRYRREGRKRVELTPTPTQEGPPLTVAGNVFAMPPVFWARGGERGLIVHELLEPLLQPRCTCRFGPIEWKKAFWVPYYHSLPPSATAEAHIEFAYEMIGKETVPDVDALPREGEIPPPTCYKEWIIGWPTSEEKQEVETSMGTNWLPRAAALERHGALWWSFGFFLREDVFELLNPFIVRPHLVVQVWDVQEDGATRLHDMDLPSEPPRGELRYIEAPEE